MTEGSAELNGYLLLYFAGCCQLWSCTYLSCIHVWPERMVLCNLVMWNQPPFRLVKLEEQMQLVHPRHRLEVNPDFGLWLSTSLLGVELSKIILDSLQKHSTK